MRRSTISHDKLFLKPPKAGIVGPLGVSSEWTEVGAVKINLTLNKINHRAAQYRGKPVKCDISA